MKTFTLSTKAGIYTLTHNDTGIRVAECKIITLNGQKIVAYEAVFSSYIETKKRLAPNTNSGIRRRLIRAAKAKANEVQTCVETWVHVDEINMWNRAIEAVKA